MAYTTEQHLENRRLLLAAVAGEIFGPDSSLNTREQTLMGDAVEIDISKPIKFSSWEDYRKRHIVLGSKEEILKDEKPSSRYGLGMLFPDLSSSTSDKSEDEDAPDEKTAVEESSIGLVQDETDSEQDEAKMAKLRDELQKRAARVASVKEGDGDSGIDLGDDESTLRLANLRKPRSMGLSFVADLSGDGSLDVTVSGGRYLRINKIIVETDGDKESGSISKKKSRERAWWARRGLKASVELSFKELKNGSIARVPLKQDAIPGLKPLDLSVEIVVRPPPQLGTTYPPDVRLVTISLVNRTKCSDLRKADLFTLFQSQFGVTPKSDDNLLRILPYPRARLREETDEEESLELLYRNELTFSTGHGCAGEWACDENAQRARSVSAEPLPSYETPAVTPDLEIIGTDGARERLKIPMAPLGGLVKGDDGLAVLHTMINHYAAWVERRSSEIPKLDERFRGAAKLHMEKCYMALSRMKSGLSLIEKPGLARDSFQFANEAMLTQQICGSFPNRVLTFSKTTKKLEPSSPYTAPDPAGADALRRAWRPFQIAFLLMNIGALINGDDTDRDLVELIWFPTGGGKTEAYLAAAAFSLFARRMKNKEDVGTHILMRYTLRLLTSQQFQRAASLICAMETIRQREENLLGATPFSIGIWVGGDTTPNNLRSAKESISKTKKDGEEEYSLVLLRCPWCGCVMGPMKRPQGMTGRSRFMLLGVQEVDAKLHCPDPKCHFNKSLPVLVVDEQLYKDPPSLVIGTVDKFAALAWRPETRALFGLDKNGKRKVSPPGLIIQDELHLITGPLGSMVGLYEAVIEELCTDNRDKENPIRPKIVSSTATTRASDRQILDLYARERASIFPPPGLDAGDSFFARYARDETGIRMPGRLYVGILPTNFSSSLTASVRTYSAVSSAAMAFRSDEERDPWWTLLVFYNSLRELGANLTLFAADIPERMRDVQRRWFPGAKQRFLNQVFELTGRLSNSEVPRALEKLSRRCGHQKYPVDACLASNIIEVGVDVDRLGIMGVAGQPKTTAQYIQATGRIGRRHPGVVLTLYSTSKPRDRSHFEHFRSYHAALYAGVEPSSVTPFTLPVLERALHAILCAWVRQASDEKETETPLPYPEADVSTVLQALSKRIKRLAKTRENKEFERMKSDLKRILSRRINEWKTSGALVWSNKTLDPANGNQPLIRQAGEACKIEWLDKAWPTPNSMRGVDAESQPVISQQYQSESPHASLKTSEVDDMLNSLFD
jgi:hypothetical protein